MKLLNYFKLGIFTINPIIKSKLSYLYKYYTFASYLTPNTASSIFATFSSSHQFTPNYNLSTKYIPVETAIVTDLKCSEKHDCGEKSRKSELQMEKKG